VPSPADPDPGQFAIAEEQIIYPMSELFHQALVAAGIDVTYQVHPGAHDIPDFLNEINAMLSWGLFKPVPNEPSAWQNSTVATNGQLWDFDYRFAQPPSQIVTFTRSGNDLSISAAGSAVTITTRDGCTVQTPTPATLHVSDGAMFSPHECLRGAVTVPSPVQP
jgi:hypothetical protein